MARGTRLDRANWAIVQRGVLDPSPSTKGNIYIQETSVGTKLWLRAEDDTTWSLSDGGGTHKAAVIDVVDATSTPPTEVLGDRYIIEGTPDPTWDGAADNDIVEFDGTNWVGEAPGEGDTVYIDVKNINYVFVDDGAGQWDPYPMGGTLNYAYNYGGAGAGRTITADNEAVVVTNNAAANSALEVTSTAAAQSALVAENTIASGVAMTVSVNSDPRLTIDDDITLKDTHLSSAITLSESGETALDTTSASLVGAINEVLENSAQISPTPTDNQIAVWLDGNTLEGSSDFRWSNGYFYITGVAQITSDTAGSDAITIINTDNAVNGSIIRIEHNRTTYMNSGDYLGSILFQGKRNGITGVLGASISAITTEAWDDTDDSGTKLIFTVKENNTDVSTTALSLDGGAAQVQLGLETTLPDDTDLIFGTNEDAALRYDESGNGALHLGLGAAGGSLIIGEKADMATNFPAWSLGTSGINPAIVLSSADPTDGNQYLEIEHNQTNVVFANGLGGNNTNSDRFGGFKHKCFNPEPNDTEFFSEQVMIPLSLRDLATTTVSTPGHGMGMVSFQSTDTLQKAYAFFTFATDNGGTTSVTLINSNQVTTSTDDDLNLNVAGGTGIITIKNNLGENGTDNGQGVLWLIHQSKPEVPAA